MINVAGEKVYPAEIEGVLVQVPDVLDASVTSIANPVTGMGIKALIRYREHCNIEDLRIKIIRHARENLEGFKQPMLYSFTLDILHTSRFKKRRTVEGRTLHETTRGY